MHKVTWSRVAAWRVRRQFLERRARSSEILAVASRLCGLHAQVFSSAELTLWARVERLEHGAVQRAVWQDRKLVKTWAMRGTLHLLPANELHLWHAALATSGRYLSPTRWEKYFGITMNDLGRLTEAIGEALDGQVMTREELARAVGHITRSPALGAKLAEGSWGTILKPAAFAGHLCFAPNLGQLVRFTRPASWCALKDPQPDSQAATQEVTRRFLAAYGPATYHDLARWWGSGMSIGRKWITAMGDEVTAVDLEGAQAWMLAEHARELRETEPIRSVRLLPAFDQYVIGASHHAAHLLPGDVRIRVYRQQGWVSPVLLVNGRMDGVWRHEIRGSRIDVTIEPFLTVSKWVRSAAEEEAERLAAFFGGTLILRWAK
ncbi:MAG TPA: winged helix DNA-binding domain-containing protein [Terriglobales bacterium]|nr:winged helix DNA-binding domain-containing protein [Terriglobales bacterium]